MADQQIFFEQGSITTGDSDERTDATAIKPILDGEAATAATFDRPEENLRLRTEVLRVEAEKTQYLLDSNMKWTIWEGDASGAGGTGTSTIPMVTWDSATGIFTVDNPIVIQPLNTPAADTQEALVYPFTDGVNDVYVNFTPIAHKRAFNGANLMRIKWEEASGTGVDAATWTVPNQANAEVSGSPEHILTLTIRNDINTSGTDVDNALTAISADLTTMGISYTVTDTPAVHLNYAQIIDVDYYMHGTFEREMHRIVPGVFSTFFGTPANTLNDGDTLALQFEYFIDDDATLTGRRQRVVSNWIIANPIDHTASDLFITSDYPERIPLAIPLCKRIGDCLLWLDGTIITETSTSVSGQYFGESGSTIDRMAVDIASAEARVSEKLDSFVFPGILFNRDSGLDSFETTADTTGLDFPVNGGLYLFGGTEYTFVADTLNVDNNAVSLVYIDDTNALSEINVTASYGGDCSAAIAALIGDGTIGSETGVPLYIVAASGGNLVSWIDVSRNVNGPVDSWSVAGRRSYSWTTPAIAVASPVLAAFDSLEAAFLYQEIYGHSDVKVTGPTYIFTGRPVTQPAGVKVEGCGSSCVVHAYNGVLTTWILSANSVISNLTLGLHPAAVTVGGCIRLADYAIIDNLNVSLTRGAENNYAPFTFPAASTVTGFKIVNCNISTDGPIFERSTACDVSKVIISNNTFQSAASYVSGTPIVFLGLGETAHEATECVVVDNQINYNLVVGAMLTSYVVSFTGHNSLISNNVVVAQLAGPGASGHCIIVAGNGNTITSNKITPYHTALDYNPATYDTDILYAGMRFDDCTNLIVSNNAVTNAYTGIYLHTCTNAKITGNQLTATWTAIYSEVATKVNVSNNVINGATIGVNFVTSATSCVASDNQILACTYVGIKASGITYSRIQNNTIKLGWVVGTISLCGIEVGTASILASITGNNIELSTLHAALSCQGISVASSAGAGHAYSPQINNNTVLIYHSVSVQVSSSTYGIYLGNAIDAYEVSNNTVFMSNLTTAAGFVSGIYVGDDSVGICNISHNLVDVHFCTTYAIGISHLGTGVSGAFMTIAKNTVTCLAVNGGGTNYGLHVDAVAAGSTMHVIWNALKASSVVASGWVSYALGSGILTCLDSGTVDHTNTADAFSAVPAWTPGSF